MSLPATRRAYVCAESLLRNAPSNGGLPYGWDTSITPDGLLTVRRGDAEIRVLADRHLSQLKWHVSCGSVTYSYARAHLALWRVRALARRYAQ